MSPTRQGYDAVGFKLRREVRDALPPGTLTAAERLLVLELADICGDDTREGWPGAAKLAELTDLSERSIQETLNRIARKWVELRVPLGKSDTGKIYYSYAGKRTTFRFPAMPPRNGATDRGSSGAIYPGAYTEQDAMDPSGRCDGSVEKVRQIRGPSPQGTSSKSNHSSLSPREAEDRVPSIPVQRSEREMGEADSQPPKPRTIPHRLLLKNGAPEEDLEFVEGYIASGNNVLSDGWWIVADRNGSLAPLVAEALQHPDLTGNHNGGYYSPRANAANNSQRSTSALRAEQALRVAAELDGYVPARRGVHQPYRNPPIEEYFKPL